MHWIDAPCGAAPSIATNCDEHVTCLKCRRIRGLDAPTPVVERLRALLAQATADGLHWAGEAGRIAAERVRIEDALARVAEERDALRADNERLTAARDAMSDALTAWRVRPSGDTDADHALACVANRGGWFK